MTQLSHAAAPSRTPVAQLPAHDARRHPRSVLAVQLLDARQALAGAGEEGAAAQQQAQQQAAERQGAGGEVLAAVHAAMADDLNTAQVAPGCFQAVHRIGQLGSWMWCMQP